jgi:hypothetical protein
MLCTNLYSAGMLICWKLFKGMVGGIRLERMTFCL